MFALRDINMTKIESRPLRSAPMQFELNSRRRSYNYLFFIDLQGSTAEASSSFEAPLQFGYFAAPSEYWIRSSLPWAEQLYTCDLL